ncbi:hypothetical protein [uncultured Mailhella sp.]|uniref:hypothetical protein n=1 Tax=uncultured Mailhella sp. TaxID=1981031 RepID=UPI00320896F5
MNTKLFTLFSLPRGKTPARVLPIVTLRRVLSKQALKRAMPNLSGFPLPDFRRSDIHEKLKNGARPLQSSGKRPNIRGTRALRQPVTAKPPQRRLSSPAHTAQGDGLRFHTPGHLART